MELFIKNTYEELSVLSAKTISRLIKEKPDCVLGLATGSTPIGTYKELIRLHHDEGLDFSKVRTFNLDEYYGLSMDPEKPYEKDQSYQRFMHEELFNHVNINKENISIPDGLTEDPQGFCRAYEEKIKKAGGIDLQLLGIGSDGHWAFNEPGSSLASRTRLQALAKQTIDDNFEVFYKKGGMKKDQMPRYALTMGIGTILESKHALMIASGKKKSRIISKALEGPITSAVTASAIQLHPGKVTVILDKGAAANLTWITDLAKD
jgi:glucosamine-6-phosphate deaminase